MKGQWLRLALLVLRDGAYLALTLAFWLYVLRQGKPHGALPVAMHGALALMTAFAGYLLHEWGHLLGAWGSGSVFALPTPFETLFLFRFDNLRNSRPQFFSMALGGFASSIVVVAFLVVALPWSVLASQIALGLTAAGVIATFVIEVPEFWRTAAGGPIPNGAAFMHPGETRPG